MFVYLSIQSRMYGKILLFMGQQSRDARSGGKSTPLRPFPPAKLASLPSFN